MKNTRRVQLAGVLSLFAACSAQAQEEEPTWTSRFYGGAMAGGLFTNFKESKLTHALQDQGYFIDEAKASSKHLGYGAWLGYGLTSHLGLELSYTAGADERVRYLGTVTDVKGALDTAKPYLLGYGDTYLARLKYFYPLNDRWFLSPRVGLGVTQTRQSFRAGNDEARFDKDSFTWAAGTGLQYLLTRNWSVGVSADYYQSSSRNFYSVVSGVVEWRFPRALPVKSVKTPEPTPEPVQVVPLVPPAPVAAPAPRPVPAPIPAPVSEHIALKGVEFETNSNKLTTGSRAILDAAAAALLPRMQRDAALQVEVSGHTDSSGKSTKNMLLSQARANAVREYLANHGLDGARLKATGYGSSQPIASNNSVEGRAQNRRVELKVSGN